MNPHNPNFNQLMKFEFWRQDLKIQILTIKLVKLEYKIVVIGISMLHTKFIKFLQICMVNA